MMNWTGSGIALVAATLLSAHACAGEGPSGHSHGHRETFSAGDIHPGFVPATLGRLSGGVVRAADLGRPLGHDRLLVVGFARGSRQSGLMPAAFVMRS